jgi:hypothetical protein
MRHFIAGGSTCIHLVSFSHVVAGSSLPPPAGKVVRGLGVGRPITEMIEIGHELDWFQSARQPGGSPVVSTYARPNCRRPGAT